MSGTLKDSANALKEFGWKEQEPDCVCRCCKINYAYGQLYTLDNRLLTAVEWRNITVIQDFNHVIIRDEDDDVVANFKVDDMADWIVVKYEDDMWEHILVLKDSGCYFKILIDGYTEETL